MFFTLPFFATPRVLMLFGFVALFFRSRGITSHLQLYHLKAFSVSGFVC